ncbi:MAG: ABC transporter permease subunit, partial [Anaerolineae bacterium]|nr:ABC transporter permease subunit [Anaerolineae bacterium]
GWDGLITIIAGGGLLWLLISLIVWSITEAEWEIIRANLTSFMAGRFPRDQLWRLSVALLLGAFGGGLLLGIVRWGKPGESEAGRSARNALHRIWPVLLLVVLLLVLAGTLGPVLLLLGGMVAFLIGYAAGRRLPAQLKLWGTILVVLTPLAIVAVIGFFGGVGWNDWGGLLLTMFLSVGGIMLSFPLGVLLALGRRSSLPVARWISVTYIEIVRGAPLIAWLFLGFVMLGFVLPAGMTTPSLVIRGVVVLTLFT